MPTLRSIALFLAAGLCEIGGGYLVWQWWRNHASWYHALAGAALLLAYGIIPTYQPASILWGWKIDHVRPDAPDLLGGLICVAGVAVIMYWPR